MSKIHFPFAVSAFCLAFQLCQSFPISFCVPLRLYVWPFALSKMYAKVFDTNCLVSRDRETPAMEQSQLNVN